MSGCCRCGPATRCCICTRTAPSSAPAAVVAAAAAATTRVRVATEAKMRWTHKDCATRICCAAPATRAYRAVSRRILILVCTYSCYAYTRFDTPPPAACVDRGVFKYRSIRPTASILESKSKRRNVSMLRRAARAWRWRCYWYCSGCCACGLESLARANSVVEMVSAKPAQTWATGEGGTVVASRARQRPPPRLGGAREAKRLSRSDFSGAGRLPATE
jgi:hypothetical protein